VAAVGFHVAFPGQGPDQVAGVAKQAPQQLDRETSSVMTLGLLVQMQMAAAVTGNAEAVAALADLAVPGAQRDGLAVETDAVDAPPADLAGAPQLPKEPAVQPPMPNAEAAASNQVPMADPQHDKKPVSVVLERWRAKRRSLLTDEELRRQLLLAPEVKLDAVPGTSRALIDSYRKTAAIGRDLTPALMARRADLLGLRSRVGDDARLGREQALNLQVLSQQLRDHVEASIPGVANGVVDLRPDPDVLRAKLLDPQTRDAWLRPEAIPTLRQLLMHEHNHVRQIYVEAVAQIKGPQASVALAERVLFDVNAEVRAAALVALKSRPTEEYRPTLIGGFLYPWPAVGDHAAEALVALDLRDVVPALVPLLDVRDAGEPFAVDAGKKRWTVVPELVRINHLRNCLLCHSPSFSPADPLRRVVPNSLHLLPLPSSGARAQAGSGGKGSWGGGGSGGGGGGKYGGGTKNATITFDWVRADITFLKQDFSVLQPVANHGKVWPADQRFDYMVRLRPVTKKELLVWQEKLEDVKPLSPQKESVMFALRELTGENPGPSAEDWKRFYSPITGQRLDKPQDQSAQLLHLKDLLVKSRPGRQEELLLVFKDRQGPVYDKAVAQALPALTGAVQKTGRTVLADRMYCVPLKELRARLRDADPEIRLAAVRVSRQRAEQALLPELIDTLNDGNPDVAKQSRDVLRHLTRRDFGPPDGANREQRQEAIAAWRNWLDRREQKGAERQGAGL
jgi:HEAT repeat protein